ncbi:hypothetical protein [Prevotella melaninogenica]|uniref:hypothetical protein n=1 Tax=Prevotella melaninogenica TaxID=28132 RepID=UPI0028EBDCC8|nr:hypothetical protein [Prevotella melaninogenica]
MKKIFFYRALSALFIGGMTFSAISCADELGENTSNDDKEAVVSFNVADAQEEAQTRGALTRGAITPGLTAKDLNGQKLAAQSNENLDVCLIETTVEGVNPVKIEPGTRANITTMANLGNFSSTGLRGTAATAINADWFSETSTKKDGTFANTRIPWSWLQPHARFYAVYPEKANSNNSITKFNKATATAAPSIEFTVNPDVRKQVDLMTACSDNVFYATRGQAPRTDLRFRHALTAIRFAVGQNLSFNKTIRKISLKNVLVNGKYTLSNKLDGSGAGWDNTASTTRGTVTLDGLNYNTNENPNSIVRDQTHFQDANERDLTKLNDNYTFYMIPQVLDNKNVEAEILFTDGTHINVTLTGKWVAGTTRTYKLSEKNSTWKYSITQNSLINVAYNGTQASYKIQSFRDINGTQQAVAWKVVGYSVDGGTTWTNTKPSWLKSLSKEQGNGGTAEEECTATLGTDIVDLLAQRNKELQNATPLGTESAPYNLSNSTGAAAVQNTANCYVISAPGYYMIPLVYGNAIKNGQTNTSAYKSTAPNTPLTFGSPKKSTDVILHNFVDHKSQNITDPWIEKTNGKANNGVNGAEVTWSDENNLVTLLPGSPIYRDASGNAYVKFEVKKENLKSGNTVISVKKGNTILWSWHLWFAPKTALDEIPVMNAQNTVYKFTNEPLGWKPTKWIATSYSTPRTVKIKVEQTVANNGTKQFGVITIIQDAHIERRGTATYYQWGRNNAFPGTDATLPQGSIVKGNDQIHMNNKIQYPNYFFTTKFVGGIIDPYDGLTKFHYFYNLWSMNNYRRGDKDAANNIEVVKTIYDPCPVGFNVPTNGAFSGFTTNGKNEGPMNVNGTNVNATYDLNTGHLFWTNSSKTETIYFPATGFRNAVDDKINQANSSGNYWSADPQDYNNGCAMGFNDSKVLPLNFNIRTFGLSVRPVAEK